jgi:hypothetical protein
MLYGIKANVKMRIRKVVNKTACYTILNVVMGFMLLDAVYALPVAQMVGLTLEYHVKRGAMEEELAHL